MWEEEHETAVAAEVGGPEDTAVPVAAERVAVVALVFRPPGAAAWRSRVSAERRAAPALLWRAALW